MFHRSIIQRSIIQRLMPFVYFVFTSALSRDPLERVNSRIKVCCGGCTRRTGAAQCLQCPHCGRSGGLVIRRFENEPFIFIFWGRRVVTREISLRMETPGRPGTGYQKIISLAIPGLLSRTSITAPCFWIILATIVAALIRFSGVFQYTHW